MAVYIDDNEHYFLSAYKSLCTQTIPPNEILISIDGYIGDPLEKVIALICRDNLVKIIRSNLNKGAGFARNLAIKKAKYPIIAIMDADDVCDPTRFEKQLPYIESGKADVVGSWISEFSGNPSVQTGVRKVPENHNEIFEYGKWRQPVNHVSIIFTRTVYNKIGGYLAIRHHEDYNFIVRLLVGGVKFYNVQEVLVNVRAGSNMITRRAGKSYLKSEFKLFYGMYTQRYIGISCLIANISFRILIRFIPKIFLETFYVKVLRAKNNAYKP